MRRRRELLAALSPAVAIEIALSLLPFWPAGLLPREMTSYLANVALVALHVGRGRIT